MFFKGKATFCPTIYWLVCGEVELRRDSTGQPSVEDVSSILFSNDDQQKNNDSSVHSKATLASNIEGKSSQQHSRAPDCSSSGSSLLRRSGDYHNSLVRSIKERMSSTNASTNPPTVSFQERQQQVRMGYLVENSERQKGVLVVCNLFEESLANNCTELEVSWVTKRSQIQQGQILYAPKVKVYRRDMADEGSIQFFIVARHVKLVSKSSAIYQFFNQQPVATSQPKALPTGEKKSKKRALVDASTQSFQSDDVGNSKRVEHPISKKVKHSEPTSQFITSSVEKKEKFRQRINAIKKKIMKKVEEIQPLPFAGIVSVKSEKISTSSVLSESASPSCFNNGFISDIVVISDEEEEEEVATKSKQPIISGLTPLVCQETPIIPSITRVKRDINEECYLGLSSSSPITSSMLYSTADQVREMCSILDKSPLLLDERTQLEENETIPSGNALFTQEQPNYISETSSSNDSASSSRSDEGEESKFETLLPSSSQKEVSLNELNLNSLSSTAEIPTLNHTITSPSPNMNNSSIKEENESSSEYNKIL